MEVERAQPKAPKPSKQKDPDPRKQVTVNPAVEGVQPKNTPIGRSAPDDSAIYR